MKIQIRFKERKELPKSGQGKERGRAIARPFDNGADWGERKGKG